MSTVSFILATTLIVVSLANLFLLVQLIWSLSTCERSSLLEKFTRTHRREDFLLPSNVTFKYSAGLIVLLNDENFELVCGVAIISKKWCVTAAHCAESIIDEPREKVKISSNSASLKHGIWYDVDKIIVNEKYKLLQKSYDAALVSIHQQFEGKYVGQVPLPEKNYNYLGNTPATLVGWSGVDVSSVEVKLLVHKDCKNSYLDQINQVKFCTEKKSCFSDYGGLLIQKNILVGIVSFGIGCGPQPIAFTKMAVFEDWIRDNKIGAVFKKNII